MTRAEIRCSQSDWTIWSHGCHGGARCRIALFAHAHRLRSLAATRLGIAARGGALVVL